MYISRLVTPASKPVKTSCKIKLYFITSFDLTKRLVTKKFQKTDLILTDSLIPSQMSQQFDDRFTLKY